MKGDHDPLPDDHDDAMLKIAYEHAFDALERWQECIDDHGGGGADLVATAMHTLLFAMAATMPPSKRHLAMVEIRKWFDDCINDINSKPPEDWHCPEVGAH